ncbi:hypothetical protein C8A01DRAFT_46105 [Parachaetomium inaequale]|uniref:Zn(2)-C6 fungal-type domain-containing protein n=1 Tax=Parachaetomium inaequale TaxID=2588326 RepID=A0AAN6SSF9_9PEZI|nr:hypothetical protein C8A01DRAFT_46105 [Parachaetomium inaequale]
MAASRRTGSSHGVGTTEQPRQLPGSACEECRKRKLRCNRQRPQCGTCADAGIVCEINHNRLPRGPKKGDLKALRSRIVALERRLSLDHGDDTLRILTADVASTTAAEGPIVSSSSEGGSPTLASPCQNRPRWEGEIHVQVPPMTPTSGPVNFSTFKFPPIAPSPSKSTSIADLMRADLDQLYFDRVHPNIPIFNHSRYLSRSRQTPWTLDLADDDLHPVRIEQVQAWLLVAFYELARSSYRRASISAGRAFRLVQLARLYEVDSPRDEDEDPVVKEERRRTFWVAYCLDRLISMRNRCPLTLTEEMVYTRLPSPELAFQGGHPIPGCFLSKAMVSGDHNFLAPLAEAALLSTICGRAISHCQVSSAERAFGSASLDFWLRHEWLDGMLTRALDSLTIHTPVVSAMADPIIMFVFMMAHATTIFMCQIAEASGIDNHCRPTILEYRHRATRAAREIAGFAKAHEHISYFKVRHSCAYPVCCHTREANAQATRGLDAASESTLEGEFRTCMDALRKIQSFNNLARDHLAVLESQKFVLGGL